MGKNAKAQRVAPVRVASHRAGRQCVDASLTSLLALAHMVTLNFQSVPAVAGVAGYRGVWLRETRLARLVPSSRHTVCTIVAIHVYQAGH
jgi:hypothetical protein